MPTLVFGIQLWQMLTDFRNCFTVGLGNKFAASPLLYFPLQLKHITMCETSADRFDLHQVTDSVCGCGEILGKMNLIFVDPGVKINGAYYRDVPRADQLLLVRSNISCKFFIFQQNSASAHQTRKTVSLLELRDTCIYFTRTAPGWLPS